MTLYLTQDEVKSILDIESTIEAVEEGFKAMGQGDIEMPPRVYLHFEKYNGVLIAMPAYLKPVNAAGLKVVTVHPENPVKHKLPAVIARIILNDPEKGEPLAIMDGTYITAMRTGAAGAVGIKYLARKDARTAGIIGLGVQGRSNLRAMCAVRSIEKVKVFDSAPSASKSFVDEMSRELGIEIEAVGSVADAAEDSDIIATCTPSTKPLLTGEMVSKGTHISAIGADTASKREIDTSVLKKVDKIVVDFRDQAFVVGDFSAPLKEGSIRKENIYAELGEIVTGKKTGRTSEEEITLYKATGLAIQDVVTAFKVYQIAKRKGIGRDI